MKPLLILTIFTVSALAQAPASPPPAPPAQPPVAAPGNPPAPAPATPAAQPLAMSPTAAAIPPDTVVATIEGKAWTKSDFDALIRNLPPGPQTNYRRDRQAWLNQYALMTRLATLAKEDGVDQREPFRQRLEYNILQFLAQAYIDVRTNSPKANDADMAKWFEAHKDQYKRARVLGIQVIWGGIPKEGEKARTVKEAQDLIDDIQKRVRAGEAFDELAKKYSDDATTKDKGGQFPLMRPEDNTLNREIKTAIFMTKAGELTHPVRLPGKFYIFKVLELVDPTQQDLRSEIMTKMGQEQLMQWLDKLQKEVKPEINSPAYFGLAEKK
ncbi:MAG: peptidylprolyl isomerase [Bryobacteraceae bacterium]